jgi:hypothetical protein
MSLTVYSALAVHLVQIMAKLYIAMYKPEEGNYEHWALFLNDGNQNVVFEVVGEHPNFTKRVIEANPKNSRRHERSILVGTINQQDVPELREKMDEVEVDNEPFTGTARTMS